MKPIPSPILLYIHARISSEHAIWSTKFPADEIPTFPGSKDEDGLCLLGIDDLDLLQVVLDAARPARCSHELWDDLWEHPGSGTLPLQEWMKKKPTKRQDM